MTLEQSTDADWLSVWPLAWNVLLIGCLLRWPTLTMAAPTGGDAIDDAVDDTVDDLLDATEAAVSVGKSSYRVFTGFLPGFYRV